MLLCNKLKSSCNTLAVLAWSQEPLCSTICFVHNLKLPVHLSQREEFGSRTPIRHQDMDRIVAGQDLKKVTVEEFWKIFSVESWF